MADWQLAPVAVTGALWRAEELTERLGTRAQVRRLPRPRLWRLKPSLVGSDRASSLVAPEVLLIAKKGEAGAYWMSPGIEATGATVQRRQHVA